MIIIVSVSSCITSETGFAPVVAPNMLQFDSLVYLL